LGATVSLTHALSALAPAGARGVELVPADARASELVPADSAASRAHRAAPAIGTATPATGPALDAITLTRGPFVQRATPSGITVRWRTSTATNGRVWYGAAPGTYSGFADDPASGTEHEVVLAGLTSATRYYYTVGSTTEIAAGGDSLTFRTHPVAGTSVPTRIWVLGDSGVPGTNQNNVRDAFIAWTGARDADVWLMLGDNAYNTGLDIEFQGGLFTPYRAQLQRLSLWPTRGNHDVVHSGANNDYYEFFTLPAAAEAGGLLSGTEAYYSFDFGPVHFICLDSEGSSRAVGGAMLIWLAADLAANARPWTIVYFHHPPYTRGSHDSDDAADSGGRMRDMRENALPILEAAGVDLVLTGHSHSYERSFLLDGHYGLSGTLTPAMKKNPGDGRPNGGGAYGKPTFGSAPNEGVVYAVDGSGAQISGGTLDHPAMVSSLNVLGSMIIDVAGERLDARFLSDAGVVRDSFAIVKGASTGVPGGSLATDGLRLGPALPNPFRSEISLSFSLATAARVRLEIFDASGRRVATLARGSHPSGTHSARWNGLAEDGRALPAGVYVASLEADGRRVTRRIALVR
ncbi:MAG: metallophosphoesterase, partial [Candidatus Eisenbacteria bacterium]